MPQSFQIGDVVKLKSGGPAMTITYLGHDTQGTPTADCQWFDGKEVKYGTFILAALVLTAEPA